MVKVMVKERKTVMAKHGERIRKRKDGRWEGRYKTGNKENGSTVYTSVYGKTYSEVKQKLREAEHGNNKFSSKKTFGFIVERWLIINRNRLKRSTLHKYEYLIDSHIMPFLKDKNVNDIDTVYLNKFVDEKLKNGRLNGGGELSKSYVRSIILIINSVMTYAVQEGWRSPLRTPIYKPSADNKELKILDVSKQIELEQKLKNRCDLTSLGILITLHTGLRIGEVCALKWDNIDFKNRIIHIRSTVSRAKKEDSENGSTLIIDTPKTKTSIRDIPFSYDLYDTLLNARSFSKSAYVISDKESFVSPRTFEYRYHGIMKKLKMPDINYHALRHSFATHCVERGVDIKSLSEILGHSNVSITLNTYVHSSMELKRAQLEKIFA